MFLRPRHTHHRPPARRHPGCQLAAVLTRAPSVWRQFLLLPGWTATSSLPLATRYLLRTPISPPRHHYHAIAVLCSPHQHRTVRSPPHVSWEGVASHRPPPSPNWEGVAARLPPPHLGLCIPPRSLGRTAPPPLSVAATYRLATLRWTTVSVAVICPGQPSMSLPWRPRTRTPGTPPRSPPTTTLSAPPCPFGRRLTHSLLSAVSSWAAPARFLSNATLSQW